MSHQITVDIADPVFDRLEQFAKDRGLDVLEGVKWLLGDFVHHNVPIRAMPASTPVPYVSDIDKLAGLARIYLAGFITDHNMKCPTCGAPATVTGLEKNECEKCKAKMI